MKEGKIEDLHFDKRNANKGTKEGKELLDKSLKEYGAGRSILSDKDGNIIAGNKTLQAAIDAGIEETIVVRTTGKKLVIVQRDDLDIDSKEARSLALLDNQVSKLNLDFDIEVVDGLADDFDINLDDMGFSPKIKRVQKNEGSLAKRFVVPPFSVLDTRQGYWIERKEEWRERIGDYGESRTSTLRKSPSADDPGFYRQKEGVEQHLGKTLTNEEFVQNHYKRTTKLPVGVSLLDPVLAEVIVEWFGLEGGRSFDCFAGDSVFGFVSAAKGMPFTGIELRQEQVDLNQQRINQIAVQSQYICDDGRNVRQHLADESQDLFFSCPPYFDLEVYSDDDNDASNQKTYAAFYKIIDQAFSESIACLKDNRFAVVVCGDIRNKKTGAYYSFPQDVIQTMRREGLHFYNECILIEQAGNAAIRAAGQMKHRKVVKTHQQVLVFYKGDPRQVKNHFPEIVYEAEDLESFGMDTDHESTDSETSFE